MPISSGEGGIAEARRNSSTETSGGNRRSAITPEGLSLAQHLLATGALQCPRSRALPM